MTTTNEKIIRLNKHDMIEDILQSWDLNNSIADKNILQDVEYALQEAFLAGALSGGMDSDLFKEAIEFFKNGEK